MDAYHLWQISEGRTVKKKKVYYVKDKISGGYADGRRGWVLYRSEAHCFDKPMSDTAPRVVTARQWAFGHAATFLKQDGFDARVVSVKV